MANLLLLQAPKKSAYAISPPSKCASRQVEFRSRLLLLPSHNLFLEKLPLELMPAGPIRAKRRKKTIRSFLYIPSVSQRQQLQHNNTAWFSLKKKRKEKRNDSILARRHTRGGEKRWFITLGFTFDGFFSEKKKMKKSPLGGFFVFLPCHTIGWTQPPTRRCTQSLKGFFQEPRRRRRHGQSSFLIR